MNNRKTYIIADFVKLLDVPRTTLKDWLSHYEHYIESETRGHRKIYFDSSLNVLKEIKEMRQDGLSASEIISALSGRHPVNPDIPGNDPAETLPAVNDHSSLEGLLMIVKQQNEQLERILVEKLQDAASDMHEAQIAALLPIVKQQHEKIERILTGKFQDMASNLHQTQLDANHIFRQQARRLLLVMALVLTAIIAVVLTSSNIFYLLKGQKEKFKYAEIKLGENIDRNRELFISANQKNLLAAEKQQQQLKKLSTILDNDSRELKKNISAIKTRLEAGSKKTDAGIVDYRNAMQEQQKRNIQELKSILENEYRIILQKLKTDTGISRTAAQAATEAAEKEAAKAAEEIKALKNKLAELQNKTEELEQAKAKAEKSRVPVMIFPGAVPPGIKPDTDK
ncbi:MAG: MerR family transcriptional regulator [Victivallales bacterium]|nr:MerR family transcriptional regulator [Victivallales bacterium]